MKTTVGNISLGSLENLPPEIVGIYAPHLESKDVLHLSMTCRSLYSLIQGSRQLWLKLLHAILDRECISRNTFDVSSMSLADIKRLVTRPSRLYHDIQKSKPINLSHTFFRLLPDDNYPTVRSHVMDASSNIAVLPGGRYIVGLAWVDGAHQFFVWDLSHLPRSISFEDPILSSVATLRFDPYERVIFSLESFRMQADPTNQRTVVLLVCGCETGTLTIEVNALNWSSSSGDTPEFVRLNYLTVTGTPGISLNPTKIALEGDIVLLRVPSIAAPYLAWDWKNHAIVPIKFNYDGLSVIGPVWAHPRGAYALVDLGKRVAFYHFGEFTPLGQNHHVDDVQLEMGVRSPVPLFQSLPKFHMLSMPREQGEQEYMDIRIQNTQPFVAGSSLLHVSDGPSFGTQALWLQTLSDPPPKTSEDAERTDVKFVGVAHEVRSTFQGHQTLFHLLDPDMILMLLTTPRTQSTGEGGSRRVGLRVTSGVTQSISKGHNNVTLNTDIETNAVRDDIPFLVALPCFRSGVFLCRTLDLPYRYCLLRYD